VSIMSASARHVHIDALRGLAVLLMVMVHAAATWSPTVSGNPTLLALVVSGLGGLAAPLFVALLGWGLYQRPRPLRQRVRQAGFLFLCQLVVNLCAPHLFKPFSPGVLSLMGLLILFEPWWSWPWRKDWNPLHVFGLFTAMVFTFTWSAGDFQGPSSWDARVETDSASTFLLHLVMTGTYPLFPWVFFAGFGMMIAASSRSPNPQVMAVGFVLSWYFLVQALRIGQVWARPTGDAMLTFFPANGPFLIAALTGSALLWSLTQRWSLLHRLADVGRCSLTIYVVHFLPFVWTHRWAETNDWGLQAAMMATLGYTVLWALLGTLWFRKGARWTLESAWRRFSESNDEQVSRTEVVG
jgi:surface polysaccharide O-acyltransferase-like enzyme